MSGGGFKNRNAGKRIFSKRKELNYPNIISWGDSEQKGAMCSCKAYPVMFECC